jgi:hypothetical protein
MSSTKLAPTPDPLALRGDLFAPFGGYGAAFAVLGPPKTGKSDFAGSCASFGKTLVLATKPREASSRRYIELGADREIFFDKNWQPSLGQFTADAYLRLLKRINELQTDTLYDFVVLDTFNDAGELAAAELLKKESAPTPRDMGDSQGFYGSLFYRQREITQALAKLQFAPHPKHVIVVAHVQPAKEESRDPGKKSADKKAQGIEYEGSVLPLVQGGYRYKFAGDFDMVFFSDVQIKNEQIREGTKLVIRPTVSYLLQTQPDAERHAGGTLASYFQEKFIANDFGAVLAAVRRGRSGRGGA